MTDVVRDFSDGEGARLSVSWRVAAGVARVPDVRGVGVSAGPAGRG